MNKTWKAYKGQYATDMKEISFKEYEPQEAKRKAFMSLNRLNKVFSIKRKNAFLYDMCLFQVWLIDDMLSKIQLWKGKPYEHLLCIPYEWDLNGTWNVCLIHIIWLKCQEKYDYVNR